MKKRIIITGLCLSLLFAGCGKSDSAAYEPRESDYAAEEAYDYSYDSAAAKSSDFSSGYSEDIDDYAPEEAADTADTYSDNGDRSDAVTEENVEEYGSKIIRNASISLEVDNLEAFSENLKKTVYDYDGYIENMDINAYDSDYSESRYGYFTVRIPAARLDDFLNIVKDEGTVTAKSESAEDVTLQYVDVEARIATYEAERDSLMELLDKATTLKDILTLRDKIAEVNYELDSLQRQLKSMQNKVSFSTVSVDAKETRALAVSRGEKTYFDKIGENFMSEMEDGLEIAIDLLIFLISRIPLFLILALVVFIIVKIIKAIAGKSGKPKMSRKEKKAELEAKKAEYLRKEQEKKQAANADQEAGAQNAAQQNAAQQNAQDQSVSGETDTPRGGHFTSNVPPVPAAGETSDKNDNTDEGKNE